MCHKLPTCHCIVYGSGIMSCRAVSVSCACQSNFQVNELMLCTRHVLTLTFPFTSPLLCDCCCCCCCWCVVGVVVLLFAFVLLLCYVVVAVQSDGYNHLAEKFELGSFRENYFSQSDPERKPQPRYIHATPSK